MKKILLIILALLTFNLALAMTVRADVTTVNGNSSGITTVNSDSSGSSSGGSATLGNPLKAKNITDLLTSMIDLAIFIGIIVAVFVFIYIGFKFVMAQGNDTKLAEAKKWFLYAVIGTAILLGSKLIVDVVKNTLTSAGVVNQDLFNKP